jgi:hypothetical protein
MKSCYSGKKQSTCQTGISDPFFFSREHADGDKDIVPSISRY